MDKNDVEESIFKELTEILYNNLKLGLIAIFLHATILLIFLLGVVDTRYLVWWYLIISLNLIGGIFATSWYQSTKNDLSMIKYHYYFYIAGSSITALMLGIISSFLMPHDMAHQALVMMGLIGITGASVQNLHASYLAAGCFLLFSLAPFLIWQSIQISQNNTIFIGIFILTMVYCIYLAVDIRTGYKTLANNIKLKHENLRLSVIDALTGLYNRHSLHDTLHRLIEQSKRNNKQFSIILFDIDHFKLINDQFGHNAGDIVLEKIGELLKLFFRETDFSFRYGGEEFLIILEESNLENAVKRIDEFRKLIKNYQFQFTVHEYRKISISSGVATFPEHGDTPELLIQSADEALYRAKKNGRDIVYRAKSIEI
ncbi:MAG: GGDEF domain-containing protein [Legionella sp.]|nr:GGDEF domain-containing protein [Legionella sp.]